MTMERKLIIADKIILGIDKHGSPEILEKFAILTQNSKIETIAPTAEQPGRQLLLSRDKGRILRGLPLRQTGNKNLSRCHEKCFEIRKKIKTLHVFFSKTFTKKIFTFVTSEFFFRDIIDF